jgi:MtfA peptidase
LNPGIDHILTENFSYYRNLSVMQKTKFRKRVEEFIKAKSFEGRQKLEVTWQMKVLISSAAIQLTFGLDEYILPYFSRIIIYPQKYLSPETGTFNRGEVHTKGILVLSWEDFSKGYGNEDDKLNVGIHEFAHALNLSDMMNEPTDGFFAAYFDKWYAYARIELDRIRKGESVFFRRSSIQSIPEFFAVSLEHYFEEPESFKEDRPELYYHTCRLLNQDPAVRDNTFALLKEVKNISFEKEMKSSESIKLIPGTGYYLWSFMGVFLLLAFFGYEAYNTHILPLFLMISFVAAAILWGIIQIKHSRTSKIIYHIQNNLVIFHPYLPGFMQRTMALNLDDLICIDIHYGKLYEATFVYAEKRTIKHKTISIAGEDNYNRFINFVHRFPVAIKWNGEIMVPENSENGES